MHQNSFRDTKVEKGDISENLKEMKESILKIGFRESPIEKTGKVDSVNIKLKSPEKRNPSGRIK